ncbi:DUF547 domain-containing protein [Desulfuromonas sp. DDH964]|uniref:DUF547 domain-containing protein n=1 Tax=Desulfuromonas sp. DDH964 TaxID=1823759 RepID=UPI0012F8FF69|nr:DUF547 domain-containing protein [Desulfuromonas sp. DDH964]
MKTLCLASLIGLGLLLAGPAKAAPKPEFWPIWQGSAPQSTQQVDHGAWARFLARYLVPGQAGEPNLVRYGAVSAADRAALQGYLDSLAVVAVTGLNRAEQKAYWINLYNALTVMTILDHYPVASIRNIKSGWFSPGPWDLKLIKVDGSELSLNDIEHRILRPIWHDNRIHYAVNCASLGCPNLQPEPFTAANSEELLERGAREYVNSRRGAHFNGATLVLSSIYDWYQADFGGSETGVLSHLQHYADPALAARLNGFQGDAGYAYDWRLNAP